MSKSLDIPNSDTHKGMRTAVPCSVILMAMAASPNAAAQQAPADAVPARDPSKLETVVITARKRTEVIDTVPLSITAMTAEKIEARNLKTIEDVASFSPGFFTQSQTGTGAGRNDRSFRQLTFRGIGASTTNVGPGAGGVAFLDGAPVLNSSLSNVQDLERVEVLRGPQGVYFGRSTFIGAVNYITKDPTEKWTGRLTSELGQDGLNDTSVSLSGAIVPNLLSARISLRHFAKEGQYATSNSGVRMGDQGTDSISLTTLLKPSDALRIRTFYNHFVDDDGPPAQYSLGGRTAASGSNCNLGGSAGPYFCGQVPQKADPARISANLTMTPALYDVIVKNTRNFPLPFDYASFLSDFGLKRKGDQASNKIEYQTESGITFTALTAYHQEQIVTVNDLGFVATTPNIFSTSVGYEAYDWSQEFRVVSAPDQRLRWTGGANYVFLKNSTSGIIGQFGTFGVLNFGNAQVGYTQAETPAAFGGLYYDIMPKLTLTAEGRYQSDKLSGHYASSATAFVDISKTYKSFSPRVSLDYKLSPTSTVYGLFSRGYKPGGFNNAILTQPKLVLDQIASLGAERTYGQEKLNNYEAGIKGSFMDGRVRMALSGYIGKYEGAQIAVPVTFYTTANANGTPNTSGPQNTAAPIRNVGQVNLKGLEFETEAIVAPGWRVGGTMAYTDTDIRNYFCGECGSILAQNATNNIQSTSAIGKRLPGAPKVAFTLSSSYEQNLSNGVTAYVGGDYIFRGSYYADAANIAESGASKIFNLRIGARTKKYSLELFARNLFDNQSPSIAYGTFDATAFPPPASTANVVRVGLPDRRRVGLRASVAF